MTLFLLQRLDVEAPTVHFSYVYSVCCKLATSGHILVDFDYWDNIGDGGDGGKEGLCPTKSLLSSIPSLLPLSLYPAP